MSGDIKYAIYEFFYGLNERELERMSDILTDDIEFYFPKTKPMLGKKSVLTFFKILFRQFPELGFTIQHTVIEEGHAAVHWTNKGVSRDGASYENEGVTLFKLQGDRLCLASDFFKNTEKF